MVNRKFLKIVILSLLPLALFAQPEAEKEIRSVFGNQIKSWNRGDLEGFMSGYWNSDSLLFIGKSGLTHGYEQTLNNYKRGYPDTASMGQLSFEILEINRLSGEYYFVVGRWLLNRTRGDLGGHFSVLFHRIRGKWLIIADHSS